MEFSRTITIQWNYYHDTCNHSRRQKWHDFPYFSVLLTYLETNKALSDVSTISSRDQVRSFRGVTFGSVPSARVEREKKQSEWNVWFFRESTVWIRGKNKSWEIIGSMSLILSDNFLFFFFLEIFYLYRVLEFVKYF